MPDPLHWLGVTKIHSFISMSDMKVRAKAGRDAARAVPIAYCSLGGKCGVCASRHRACIHASI